MGTKTISIMDDVYDLLIKNKFAEESFSEEIRRLLGKKKTQPLSHYFGILAEKEAEYMHKDLQKIKEYNQKQIAKRLI